MTPLGDGFAVIDFETTVSGKARKARECGVPVIDSAAYFRLRDRMPHGRER